MLRPEDKVNGHDKAEESRHVIPVQGLLFPEEQHERGEYDKRDDLLDHLQLPQRERPAVFDAADAVGRNLKTVFEQGYTPAQQNDQSQRNPFEFRLEDDVPVPCQRHEGIGTDEQQNGKESSRHEPCVIFSRPKSSKKYDSLFLVMNYSLPLRGNPI